MIRKALPRIRSGFTLVELLVSAAVIVIIMAVLATTFQLATDTMRDMKAVTDLAGQLRSAETVIRRDLSVDHFLPEAGKPNGGVHVSDQTLDLLTVSGSTLSGWRPPRAGFFRIRSTQSILEGTDSDGLTSTRATDHYLHFTAIQPDTVDSQPYTANISGNKYTSRAAEIAIFLDPVPSGSTTGTPSLSLYRLVRRQRLVALNQGYVNSLTTNPVDDAVISTRYDSTAMKRVVNSLADVGNPDNRLGGSRFASPVAGSGNDSAFAPLSSSSRLGEDTLLTHVISFEVRVAWVPAKENPLSSPPAPKLPYVRYPTGFTPAVHTDYPFDSLPPVPPSAGPASGADPAHTQGNTGLVGQNIFDTWSQLSGWNTINTMTGELTPSNDIPPLLIRVQALQIRIRVWDPNTQSTRQITIVQEL